MKHIWLMEIQQYQSILIAINVHKPQLQKCFPEEVSEPLCRSGLQPVQMHFRNQGSKLRPIRSPMRLTFPPWRLKLLFSRHFGDLNFA